MQSKCKGLITYVCLRRDQRDSILFFFTYRFGDTNGQFLFNSQSSWFSECRSLRHALGIYRPHAAALVLPCTCLILLSDSWILHGAAKMQLRTLRLSCMMKRRCNRECCICRCMLQRRCSGECCVYFAACSEDAIENAAFVGACCSNGVQGQRGPSLAVHCTAFDLRPGGLLIYNCIIILLHPN